MTKWFKTFKTGVAHVYHLLSRKNGLPVCCAVLVALVGGCADKPLSVPYDPANFGSPDATETAKAPQTIGPGDKVRVTVFQVDSLSGQFPVEDSGQINYPLLGGLRAQGLTPAELANHISEQLKQKYLKTPDVQVAVIQSVSSVTVEGAVNQAGILPVEGTTTLIRAIALARGTKDAADPKRVVVFRQVNGRRMAAAFDLRAIRRAEAPDPTIYPNDVVVVPDSRSRKMFEDILRAIPAVGIFRPF